MEDRKPSRSRFVIDWGTLQFIVLNIFALGFALLVNALLKKWG